MAEYIDKEIALSLVQPDAPEDDTAAITIATAKKLVRSIIYRTPTADVAPVVHGRWEWFDEETGTPITGYEREWGWRCSQCKEELPDNFDDPDCPPVFRYCCHCGAKMDEKKNI